MISGTETVSNLVNLTTGGARRNPRYGWSAADDIDEYGWDEAKRIKLIVREGSAPYLEDGNRRVAALSARGLGDIEVPVQIEFRPLRNISKLDKRSNHH